MEKKFLFPYAPKTCVIMHFETGICVRISVEGYESPPQCRCRAEIPWSAASLTQQKHE